MDRSTDPPRLTSQDSVGLQRRIFIDDNIWKTSFFSDCEVSFIWMNLEKQNPTEILKGNFHIDNPIHAVISGCYQVIG